MNNLQNVRTAVTQPVKRMLGRALQRVAASLPAEVVQPLTALQSPRRNQFTGERLTYRGPSVLSREQWACWYDNGYLVLPKFFGQYRLDEINALIDRLWEERKRPDNRLVADVFFGPHGGSRMFFRDAPDEARQHPYKLLDLFLDFELIREMIADAALCRILAELLDGDPMACNTLNFERGSQQEFHFDTFYMPAPVENKMVATWIALEDAHPDSGPLQYYEGSHKIPPYYFSTGRLNAVGEELPRFQEYIQSELAKRNLKPTSFAAQAGDVLIWHSQLYHGGCEIRDPGLTRKSLVTHYFRAMDFPQEECSTIAPGRHYLKREPQRVS